MAITFQSPKGTRDFYPDEMAVRRYIEDVWRRVSIRHGFVEVDGPTFELLDLYRVKSGDEIVSQLFHFQDRGERELALRPEFTPTLARMVAAKANSLPRPIKWFCLPRCFRAEAPQKGRTREFIQWNVDIIGDASEAADQACVALTVDVLKEFGLTEQDVRIGWNHRGVMSRALGTFMPAPRVPAGFEILDRMYKLDQRGRAELYAAKGCTPSEITTFERLVHVGQPASDVKLADALPELESDVAAQIARFATMLDDAGVGQYATWDPGVVRGLAYYTGFVFEVFDRVGQNRAVAGGGRYDKLIEMFGGPSLPAVGVGMGDVVLEIVLREHGKMPQALLPRPAAFVVNALDTPVPATRLLAALRESVWDDARTRIVQPGLHAITSGRATKNIGKLLQDAAASGARVAIILAPAEMERGMARLKDMATREERDVPLAAVVDAVRQTLSTEA